MKISFVLVVLFNIVVGNQIWYVEFPEDFQPFELIESILPGVDLIQHQSSTYVFLVPNGDKIKFEDFIHRHRGRYNVIFQNSNELLKQTLNRKKRWSPSSDPLDPVYHKHFLSYDEQNQWYQLLKSSPKTKDHVRFYNIGRTHENRTLTVIKLFGKTHQNKTYRRRRVFIDAGMHAREWLTIGVANYLIHRFIELKATDQRVQRIFRYFDVYLLPIMNPDGYEYSRKVDRLWRKNRAPTSHSEFWNGDPQCVGIDLNRNFPYKWEAVAHDSIDVCSGAYRGPTPASELEVKSVVHFLNKSRPYVYFNLHTYGRLWLFPWSYSKYERIPNYQKIIDRANRINKKVTNGTYAVGQVPDLLYRCSGTSIDFASSIMPHAMTFELSPIFQNIAQCFSGNAAYISKCESGFVTGPESIEIDGREMFEIIVEYLCSLIEDDFN